MNNCYCGREKSFEECCKPFIDGDKLPKTPEELMRSRFSAYVVKNIDYIYDTHDPKTREGLTKEMISTWANTTEWTNLEVIFTKDGKPGDETGIVEFKGNFLEKGYKGTHHEISTFKLIGDRWFYHLAEYPKNTILKDKKIKRNDPCICGSGKKYKKCCG